MKMKIVQTIRKLNALRKMGSLPSISSVLKAGGFEYVINGMLPTSERAKLESVLGKPVALLERGEKFLVPLQMLTQWGGCGVSHIAVKDGRVIGWRSLVDVKEIEQFEKDTVGLIGRLASIDGLKFGFGELEPAGKRDAWEKLRQAEKA